MQSKTYKRDLGKINFNHFTSNFYKSCFVYTQILINQSFVNIYIIYQKYIIYELSEMYDPIPLREEGRNLRWRKREEGVKVKKGEGGWTNFVKNFRNFEILTPESCFRLKIV